MASMRDIRIRIKSIRDTMSITKAMKLISASKLKKARQQFEVTVPFFNKIQSTLKFILAHTSGEEDLHYFDKHEDKKNRKIGYVIISGDKSLCGGYNNNIIKFVEKELSLRNAEDCRIFVIGNVGKVDLIRRGHQIDNDFLYAVQNPTFSRAREIANTLIDLYNCKELDEINLVYTQMINSLQLEPTVMKLLPLESIQFQQTSEETELAKYLLEFDFNPSMKEVFDRLVPQYLRGIVYGALVESFTSEQSARMTAMDSATRNAEELIKKLTILYNRARQAIITQEITEIISGAETIKS